MAKKLDDYTYTRAEVALQGGWTGPHIEVVICDECGALLGLNTENIHSLWHQSVQLQIEHVARHTHVFGGNP